MKKYLVFIVISFLCFRAESATTPSAAYSATAVTNPVNPLQFFSTISLKEVQKIAGRKLKLKEKIAVKIFQWKIKNGFDPTKKAGNTEKGKLALIFGILGLATLFIPYVNLLSIPLTVLALVFGYQAKKINPNDSKANTAVILGWVTVGIYVVIIGIVIAILLSGWTFGWG